MGYEAKKWFEGGLESKALPDAKTLDTEHQLFKRRVRGLTSRKDKDEKFAATKSELLQQIDESQLGFQTQSRHGTAIQQFRRASLVQGTYEANREHGAKKFGKLAQEKATSLAQFVEKYSNIIEAVASAGGPYGIVAYQTLSILFSVIVKKGNNDKKVVQMLEQLHHSLPRLEYWESIYPTESMRICVADAYSQIMEFSRKAAEYLSGFWKRLLPALFPLLGYKFYDISSEINKTLAEISDEAMYGLHQRSQRTEVVIMSSGKKIEELEATQQRLIAQNQELKDKLEQKSEEDDQRRLSLFQDLLGVKQHHPGTDIRMTKKALMEVFSDLPLGMSLVSCTGYRRMSRNLLDQCRSFYDWKQSTESALLFLSGRTDYDGRKLKGYLHSWLSPIAVYITEDLQQTSKNIAFFSCLPCRIFDPVPAGVVFSSIISQVLQWKPEMLRTNEHRFHHLLESTGQSDEPWTVNSLTELLIGILEELRRENDETVYLVIDRLDRCHGVEVEKAMQQLARLVSLSDVKIVVISETWGSDEKEWRTDWRSQYDYPKYRLFSQQHWDQKPLTTIERSTRVRPQIWSDTSLASIMTV